MNIIILRKFFFKIILLSFFYPLNILCQEKKLIEIIEAGKFSKDEENFPKANILSKENNLRVKLFHDDATIISDKTLFYSNENKFFANGSVWLKQGDSLELKSDYLNYDGNEGKAKAWGKVVLIQPDMTLKTDTLYLDRVMNIAYYDSYGIIDDKENILKSKKGKYLINEKKYSFKTGVKINNPKYNINSENLDYNLISKNAYFFGPTLIIGNDYEIHCEKGNFDMLSSKGNFQKNPKIFYNNKIIEGDSIFYNESINYASATKNVIITDTINNSIIKGEYGEIYKHKDSAIITKRALAINIIENDSLYIHADTLIGTGPTKQRILRGYYGVKILKSDIRGISDSIYFDESKGKIELHKKPLSKKQTQILSLKSKLKLNPVVWFNDSQMSGNEINLLTDLKTKKLDSLLIFGNSFIIEQDSINKNNYNQIEGMNLNGDFVDGGLNNLQVLKNIKVIYYLYSDDGELVGIDKTICSELKIKLESNEIKNITFYTSPEGKVHPEDKLDPNLKLLEGFIWRKSERPESLDDLFK
ncbi:OstA-like protein [Bacteroidota bacterium]|nr:OstA-like protein [Bacteroidota bacterium]